ncbi:hypothetical protein [Mycolicibacterium sp. lyk4-40-TYG-92]|uniref:hypothetical protein n=1 Tax=Mycolicibacterium sp. lyk4-40-TYG-92 TaxID=3040295 RepID=UPI00254D7BFB|nr:hypothetical protein [Mycolicibacterium sp. lyk4-40-TYG-92]
MINAEVADATGPTPGARPHRGLLAALAAGEVPEGLLTVLRRTAGIATALLSATGT